MIKRTIKREEHEAYPYICDPFYVGDQKMEVTKQCRALAEMFQWAVLATWWELECLIMITFALPALGGIIELWSWLIKTYRQVLFCQNSVPIQVASTPAEVLPTHFTDLLCSFSKVLTYFVLQEVKAIPRNVKANEKEIYFVKANIFIVKLADRKASLKKISLQGSPVAQSIKHPTPDDGSGGDLRVLSWSPAFGSALGMEPALPLPHPTPPMHYHSL